MRLLPLVTLFLAGTAIAGCGSGAHDRLRNEAEMMYRVPAYPAAAERRDVEDQEVVYVRSPYGIAPPDCDDLVYGGDGYYYCSLE